MEKSNIFQKTEISRELAWRIISAMQVGILDTDLLAIVRISCYQNREIIQKSIRQFYSIQTDIKKFPKPFPLNLLPIPSSYYFYLYDVNINHIYELAKLCDEFLMFEIAILDKKGAEIIRKIILNSRDTLYTNIIHFSHQCQCFFMCGFDFDDLDFESGVSKVAHFNFIPTHLSLYF